MKLKIHKIVGDSMSPTIRSSDYVVSLSTRNITYKNEDIVVVNHKEFQTIIKRVADVRDNGDMWLTGDNPHSTPSDVLGWQTRESIIGKVRLHIPGSRKVHAK